MEEEEEADSGRKKMRIASILTEDVEVDAVMAFNEFLFCSPLYGLSSFTPSPYGTGFPQMAFGQASGAAPKYRQPKHFAGRRRNAPAPVKVFTLQELLEGRF